MDFKNFVYSVVGVADVIKVKDMLESITSVSEHMDELQGATLEMVKHTSHEYNDDKVSAILTRLGIKGKDVATRLESLSWVINNGRALLLEMGDIIKDVGEDEMITFNSMSYRVTAATAEIERLSAYANTLSDILVVISYIMNNDDLPYKNKYNEIIRVAAGASITTLYLAKIDVPKVAKEVRSLSNEPVQDEDPNKKSRDFEPIPTSDFLYNPI